MPDIWQVRERVIFGPKDAAHEALLAVIDHTVKSTMRIPKQCKTVQEAYEAAQGEIQEIIERAYDH